jgi:5-methyltetrahydrofolate--homocysteine methyltransferase
MCAEAATAAFDEIRLQAGPKDASEDHVPVVIATVKGDIHDIGKNIVRLMLESYGFPVTDLGKDTAPETILQAVLEKHAPICGLSALMTTTVPSMARTIELLRAEAPWCRVVVGGAVLNPEYAQMVGADFYAKDANETARIAGEVLG